MHQIVQELSKEHNIGFAQTKKDVRTKLPNFEIFG